MAPVSFHGARSGRPIPRLVRPNGDRRHHTHDHRLSGGIEIVRPPRDPITESCTSRANSPMMVMAPPPPPPPAPVCISRKTGRRRITMSDATSSRASRRISFKIVREAPVSTFSIDVDTASYSWVRASLNQNILPQPASVRTEEMVNYFPYDYAPPRTREQPFSTNVAVYPSPWCAGTQTRSDRDQRLFGRARRHDRTRTSFS